MIQVCQLRSKRAAFCSSPLAFRAFASLPGTDGTAVSGEMCETGPAKWSEA